MAVRPDGPLHFNSSSALIGAALRGSGLVHVLDAYIGAHVASGELAMAYPDWTTTTKPFYAVTPKTRVMSPKIRALIDFLLETLDPHRRPQAWQTIRVGAAAGALTGAATGSRDRTRRSRRCVRGRAVPGRCRGDWR